MYLERYAHAFNLPKKGKSEKLKKSLIKFLVFWIFPTPLRRQAKRRLKYWFGLAAEPESLWERYIAEKTRKQFIEAHRNNDIFAYKIVSLGCNCFPRTIPTLWGLKPRKKQGEKGCPFDLSDNPLPNIAKYLQNDFDGYFDTLAYHPQLRSWWIAKDEIVYCHEDDCNENSRDTIISRFTGRINNLRDILKQDAKPALFISYFNPMLAPDDIDEICRLYNQMFASLQQYRKDRAFRFLIVDTSGKLAGNKDFHPEIKLLSYPWLPQPYVWHEPQCRYKKSGLKFEQDFILNVKNIINEMMVTL